MSWPDPFTTFDDTANTMTNIYMSIGSIVILVTTVTISLLALYVSPRLLTDFVFRPYDAIRKRRFDALYMSGFIHGSLGHLLLNMISFCFFAFSLERRIGTARFVLFYFMALVASLLPTLYRHRNDPHYACLGASGAVVAVIFAYVVYFPGASLYVMPFPVPIPAPLYAVGYITYSWYSSRQNRDNINHGAHLAGGIFGLLFVIATDWPAVGHFLARLN